MFLKQKISILKTGVVRQKPVTETGLHTPMSKNCKTKPYN